MRKLCYALLVVITIVGYSACSSTLDKRVDACLQFAGENKTELEKVLSYYRKEPLKLQAAKFLMANMPYYYSYTDDGIEKQKEVLRKVIADDGFIEDSVKNKWTSVHFSRQLKKFDAHEVTADLLIENIDLAFEVWQRRPWSRCYTFDDFCEYILPYRIKDEPLEPWRRQYYDRYAPVLDSLYKGNDVVEAAKAVVAYLKDEKFTSNKDFDLPHLGASYLLEHRVGFCRENCDIATYVLRALGIPVTTDMYQTSPVYQSRHYWSALIDTTKCPVPFNYVEEEMRRGYMGKRKMGKVYRQYFGYQPEKCKGMYGDETVPVLFANPFLGDVTADYMGDIAATIPLNSETKSRYMYLAVWTGRNYEPIDITEPDGRQAVFRGLEKDVVYQPVYCDKETVIPAYYPFQIEDSVTRFFVPDTVNLQYREVRRKYPVRGNIRSYMNHVQWMKIEADNRKDFKNACLIHHVVDTPLVNYNRVVLKTPARYRYFRMVPRHTRRIQMAEFWLYKDTAATERLVPVDITPDTVVDRKQLAQIRRMVDDDWVTCCYSERRGEIVTFDYGVPVEVKSIVYIPRNDDNFIRVGDEYELFYQNGKDGWRSLGKRSATDYVLKYDNVPDNALLWLRNYSRGKEERAFYYENGRQVFP
ncbi:hypothetical protein [uncultured Bacteroides sp.]|uniref:hypothetical protein n=1 Tax=uncultured Bacteroides sp. TaxID=162156 RepID=UPI0025F669AC|nr:hypothetical protein [uncultured Bacteroides sp.]